MKIKKVQSVCFILACIAATGLIGCGKTDKTPEKHEAITFMAPYMDVDSFIDEVHKTYPEINLEVVPYSGANTTVYLNTILEEMIFRISVHCLFMIRNCRISVTRCLIFQAMLSRIIM